MHPIRCFVHFAQIHSDFRLPELQSIAELYGFRFTQPTSDLSLDALTREWDPNRPFWIIDFEDESHALQFAERCVLVKSIYELYASGSSYEKVYAQTRANSYLWGRYVQGTSFRFTVSGYNHSIPRDRTVRVVESFSFMDFKGPVDLKAPELSLVVFEEYADRGTAPPQSRDDNDGNFVQIYFGRLISEGKARPLVQIFDVKKRAYYGNTSMDAEISLLMANQALASPGKFIYDPFVGTGSMIYTAAYFGAFVFGSDIDGRQIRGKGSENELGVIRAAAQYGVMSRIVDLCTYDITHNPLRCGALFDAIVTDPPYGVRAGAKRLGRKNTDRRHRDRRPDMEDAQTKGIISYNPPTHAYELSELIVDLIRFARHVLRPNGRLVFFLPTVIEEYEEVDVQTSLCEGMAIIANSVQSFESWGRRLITIKKITSQEYPSPFVCTANHGNSTEEEVGASNGYSHMPAHKDFREKYFRGFRKANQE